MPRDASFQDYVVRDLLGEMPGVTSRTMFGGWALYKRGVIFGIIIAGELYLKVGENNRAEFEAMESHPFVYTKKDGKKITMSYWLVIEEVLENKERLYELVEQAARINKKQ